MTSKFESTLPKEASCSPNYTAASTEAGTNLPLHSPFPFMEDTSRDSPLNAGWTKQRGTSRLPETNPSRDERRAIELKIVRLQGERYTTEARLRWLDAGLTEQRALLASLKE